MWGFVNEIQSMEIISIAISPRTGEMFAPILFYHFVNSYKFNGHSKCSIKVFRVSILNLSIRTGVVAREVFPGKCPIQSGEQRSVLNIRQWVCGWLEEME